MSGFFTRRTPVKPTLDERLAQKGLTPGPGYQGYSQQIPAQVERLRALTLERRPRRILEIGFNAGHSAEIFLSTTPDSLLVSFDLGHVPAVVVGKEHIDATFPGRHTLVVGDSTASVPAFTALAPDIRFDLIFIDGGHTYDIARADILNCAALAGESCVVMVDDTIFTPAWEQHYTIGPTKAWTEAVQAGSVTEAGREEYALGRGMVWGRYR